MNVLSMLYIIIRNPNKQILLKNIFSKYFRKSGKFICPNGYELPFNEHNKDYVYEIYLFSLYHGVEFSDKPGYWKFKNGIIETPNGIKFDVKYFSSLIFAETFLYDIHFCDPDLEGKVVVTAGAYVGDTPLYFASRGAKVYAFEPDSELYEVALHNLSLNPELAKNIVLKNYAIGNDGEVDFPINRAKGSSSVYDISRYKTVKVRSVSVSTILKEFNISEPYLLDLDIKGKEFDVINDDAISKFKIVRIEYNINIGGTMIGTRDELIDKLKEYGFRKIRVYKPNELVYDLHYIGIIEARK
ncbi:MAG: FkbM family methyltransferase [Saccharolobus sp.]